MILFLSFIYFSIPTLISDYFIYKLFNRELKINIYLKISLFVFIHMVLVSLLFVLSIFYIGHCVRDC